jgi:hypothetical protein
MAEFFTEELLQGFQKYKTWLEEGDPARSSPRNTFVLTFINDFFEDNTRQYAIKAYGRCLVTQKKYLALWKKLNSSRDYALFSNEILQACYSFRTEARMLDAYHPSLLGPRLFLSATFDNDEDLRLIREAMPRQLAEQASSDLLSNEQFKFFCQEVPKLTQHLETIETLKAEVISLKNTLEAQKTEFNFVGLNQGFENVRNKKLDELKPVNRFSNFLIFLILTLPIGLSIRFAVPHVGGLEAHLLATAPVFGLELLALYFYRVNLQHMRSIKAQIVQLELRQALCQFIQSYAEYSKKIKDENGAALDKFENLIFSGLAVNENQVPTTFDGLETLTNLIKSFKK